MGSRSPPPVSSNGPVSPSSIPPIGHAIGGAVGSALALLLFYPLERARIEMQAAANQRPEHVSSPPVNHTVINQENRNIPDLGASESSESWVSCLESDEQQQAEAITQDESPPTSTQQAAGKRVNKGNNGLVPTLVQLHDRRELYRGVGPVVTTLAASNFVFFYAHQVVMRYMGDKKSATWSLLASSLAGMVNVLVTNPLWVANMRIIKGDDDTDKSLIKQLFNIGRSDGWKHLWNGTGASLLLVSNPVLQFFVYNQVKTARLKKKSGLSPVEAFYLGAVAKAVATVSTYPLQLMQVLLRLEAKDNGTIWGCLKQQYKRGGIPALFTGMNAKLIQTVLTAAFTFLTYEQILKVCVKVTLMARKEQRSQLSNPTVP